ncbi:MAG: alpha/beta hydrolase, partial [Propionibacteriaceae bacterium]
AQLLTWLALRTPGLLRLTTWWLATFPGAVRSSIASALAGGTQTPGFDDLVQLAATEARRKQQHHERALDDWQVLAYGPRAMRTSFLPELGQIARPTLWLRGEADPLVSRQDVAAAVAATPGALAAAIPQAGHLAPLDQPDVVARHVVDFLSTLD